MSPNPKRKNPVSGPGPVGSTRQVLVNRWVRNLPSGEFRYGTLACGHKVRMDATCQWEIGAPVPCGECPPRPSMVSPTQRTAPDGETEQDSCPCGKAEAFFNAPAAKGLTAAAIRKRWPRGYCTTCGVHVYGNWQHYVQGRWDTCKSL